MAEATQPTDSIDITPEWEGTAFWFAAVLAEHGFDRNAYSPVESLIEQIRYLMQTDPDAVERILRSLRARDG